LPNLTTNLTTANIGHEPQLKPRPEPKKLAGVMILESIKCPASPNHTRSQNHGQGNRQSR
jgi:hypothetical protein